MVVQNLVIIAEFRLSKRNSSPHVDYVYRNVKNYSVEPQHGRLQYIPHVK